jgi:hypothetical protein
LPDESKKGRKPRKRAGRKPASKTERDLFTEVVRATGIPAESIEKELRALLERRGVNVERLTLAQLRAAVAQYLREVMAEILERTQLPPRPNDA